MPPIITSNIPLASKTTLGIGGNAEYYASVTSRESLREVIQWAQKNRYPITVLGGGSNILVPDEGVPGLVVELQFTGIVYAEHEQMVDVTAGASVPLDVLVTELVTKKLWGLENLSAIPGTVGAVPIQNVGAYGIEAKDIVANVTVYDPLVDAFRILNNADCAFAYRDSIFKHTPGAHYIITEVTFAVTHIPTPRITYKDLALYFTEKELPSIQDVRDAVISIRKKKFPDWNTIGTAGSFFKNPIIAKDKFAELRAHYPDMPGYEQEGGNVKVSLGWILDHVCGLRGYREGEVALYEAQALVLVCTKRITAREVKNFSEKIIAMVFEKTGIHIEREVTMLAPRVK